MVRAQQFSSFLLARPSCFLLLTANSPKNQITLLQLLLRVKTSLSESGMLGICDKLDLYVHGRLVGGRAAFGFDERDDLCRETAVERSCEVVDFRRPVRRRWVGRLGRSERGHGSYRWSWVEGKPFRQTETASFRWASFLLPSSGVDLQPHPIQSIVSSRNHPSLHPPHQHPVLIPDLPKTPFETHFATHQSMSTSPPPDRPVLKSSLSSPHTTPATSNNVPLPSDAPTDSHNGHIHFPAATSTSADRPERPASMARRSFQRTRTSSSGDLGHGYKSRVGFDTFDDSSDDALFSFTLQCEFLQPGREGRKVAGRRARKSERAQLC